MGLNIEKLLTPVSDDSPCGPDLQDEAEYASLERLAVQTPERVSGDETIPAQEPNWKEILKDGQKLAYKTKDLNLAIILSRALLHCQGFLGFQQGLVYLYGLLDQYWDSIHPQLDADDPVPLRRINILKNLLDNNNILSPLRETSLIANKVGKFSLRDYHIATGNIAAGKDEAVPDIKLINAAFMDAKLEEIEASARLIQSILKEIEKIDTKLSAILSKDQDQGVNFGVLQELFKEIDKIYSEQLQLRGVQTQSALQDAGDASTQTAQQGSGMVGSINSREDVVRVLDLASDYFRRNEPSSPVPLLLQRAKHLLSKDFMEILRDLAPDAVKQAELIGGVQDKD